MNFNNKQRAERNILNLVVVISFVLFSALLVGCGGDDDISGIHFDPIISDLRYTPASAALNQGGGSITVSANVWCDENLGGNISTVSIVVGSEITTLPVNSTNFSPNDSGKGMLSISFTIPTTSAGSVNFNVHVTNNDGRNSNAITGTITIT